MKALLVGLILVLDLHATLAVPAQELSPRFSELLNNSFRTGQTEDSAEDQARIREQFKNYLKFEDRRLSRASKQVWVDLCEKTLEENPFCSLVVASSSLSNRLKTDRSSSHQALVKRFIRDFRPLQKNPSIVPEASLREWNSAMKKISKLSGIEKISDWVLSQSGCQSVSFLTALGLKLEQGFPDAWYRNLVSRLYEKASECGENQASIAARYRLGLMRIWEGKYEDADKILARIPDSLAGPDPEYRLRAGYWRYYCADRLNNQALKTQLRDWLVREYPLSLHSVVARSENKDKIEIAESAKAQSSFLQDDPYVWLRSKTDRYASNIVRAAEILIAENRPTFAGRLLRANLARLPEEEPFFQLYWAILLKRAEDRISSFQLLAQIFRDNPELISKNTLQLMYPLHRLPEVQRATQELDPFLVISLIRQESAFNQNAKSPAGALGLMQLMPRTARLLERRVSKRQLYDPQTNIRLGVRYFEQLLKNYQGEVALALAAYNAGPGNIKDLSKRYPVENRLLFLDLLPLRETREYVSSIARNYFWYNRLYPQSQEFSLRKMPLLQHLGLFSNPAQPGSPEGAPGILAPQITDAKY